MATGRVAGINSLRTPAEATPDRPELKIVMSQRFERAYHKSNALLKGLVEGSICDLVRRIRSDPRQVKHCYDRLSQLPQLLEVDVSGAHRMIAHWDSHVLRLLDVGGKAIIPRYTSSMAYLDQLQNRDVPIRFYPDEVASELRFFTRNPCLRFQQFGLEQSSEWVYFLSDQQAEIVEELRDRSWRCYSSSRPLPVSFIIGGPGTGKTNILINLLKDLTEDGFGVKIHLGEEVAKYLDASHPEADLQRFLVRDGLAENLVHPTGTEVNMVLVDDPRDAREVRGWLERSTAGSGPGLVLAFDPCQLSSFDPRRRSSGITDVEFEELVREYRVELYELNACYRQKENIGIASKKAMKVIADSTPFRDHKKIHEFRESHRHLTEISNNLTFLNPLGQVQVYQPDTLDGLLCHLGNEINRIAGLPLWTYWPPVLFVIDRAAGTKADDYMQMIFSSLKTPVTFRNHSYWLDDVESVKGLEYQHVLLFLGRDLFMQLESGFQGTGQPIYNQRRLIRIPFSRAKDSMVVFVCEGLSGCSR